MQTRSERLLAALKRAAAVTGAEQTVAGAGWLPSCLRTLAAAVVVADDAPHEAPERTDAEAQGA